MTNFVALALRFIVVIASRNFNKYPVTEGGSTRQNNSIGNVSAAKSKNCPQEI